MPNPSPISILLVEDDKVDQMNVKRALAKNNITNPLHIAENGLEALDLLLGKNGKEILPPPKLALVDINMPKMNGIEFIKEVRNNPKLKSLSIFVLTTSDDDRDMIEAYELNVAGYIVKPIDFAQFVEAVKTLNAFWQICERPAS